MKLQNDNMSSIFYTAAIAAWLSICGAIEAATIFSDTFPDSGSLSNYTSDQTLSFSSGAMNVLQTTNGTATRASFASTTLANTGDYLELTIDLDISDNDAGGFRYGFFTSGDGVGYAGNIGTPGGSSSTGSSGFVQNGFGVNASPTAVADGWTNVSTGLDGDVAQTMLFRVTRNASDGLDLLATWSTSNNGASVTSLSHTITAGDVSQYTFDAFAFSIDNGGAGSEYTVDNVIVTTNIPEPSSLALMAMSCICVLRRRRH